MLRARLNNGVYILGLDSENIRRLKDDHPILISLAELGGTDDVLIVAGETLADIKSNLEKMFDSKIPEPTEINKLRKLQ